MFSDLCCGCKVGVSELLFIFVRFLATRNPRRDVAVLMLNVAKCVDAIPKLTRILTLPGHSARFCILLHLETSNTNVNGFK